MLFAFLITLIIFSSGCLEDKNTKNEGVNQEVIGRIFRLEKGILTPITSNSGLVFSGCIHDSYIITVKPKSGREAYAYQVYVQSPEIFSITISYDFTYHKVTFQVIEADCTEIQIKLTKFEKQQ